MSVQQIEAHEAFASAHPARIASKRECPLFHGKLPLPQHTPHGLHPRWREIGRSRKILCLSTPRTDCIQTWCDCLRCQYLCLSTPRTDCIQKGRGARGIRTTLPQHTPHGLHQQNRTDAMPQIHAICCELVDSFSDATKAASALTIFPRFSTVKAIYIAIIDSLGRTIDRFFGANRTEKIC